jgi:hypothetical protein
MPRIKRFVGEDADATVDVAAPSSAPNRIEDMAAQKSGHLGLVGMRTRR